MVIGEKCIRWHRTCMSAKYEGELGFKSLFDVSRALFTKCWWIFRTKKSLWDKFMWNK